MSPKSRNLTTVAFNDFIAKGFSFEPPVFLFLVIMSFIITTFNAIVISALRKKSMRSATNTVLVAIAVSDSLTGLVMVPSHLYLYQSWEPDSNRTGAGIYVVSEGWCNFWMISRFFLARCFHTVSIWLTLLLCFQRFVCVRFPFKAKDLFTNFKTVLIVAVVYLVAPVLHIYHLFDRKAQAYGYCEWEMEKPCVATCIYLWLAVILVHFLPCALLILFTTLMLIGLLSGSRRTSQHSEAENRRVSIIVIVLVVVFLIPEVPYGLGLLVTLVREHAGKVMTSLETNRASHNVYEILLSLGFHANFWIYTVMNRRFRAVLKKEFRSLKRFVSRLLIETSGGKDTETSTPVPKIDSVEMSNLAVQNGTVEMSNLTPSNGSAENSNIPAQNDSVEPNYFAPPDEDFGMSNQAPQNSKV